VSRAPTEKLEKLGHKDFKVDRDLPANLVIRVR